MRYLIHNPEQVTINVDGLVIPPGETKDFTPREADFLLERYPFLTKQGEAGEGPAEAPGTDEEPAAEKEPSPKPSRKRK
jgi:hypothetical protein